MGPKLILEQLSSAYRLPLLTLQIFYCQICKSVKHPQHSRVSRNFLKKLLLCLTNGRQCHC